MVMVLWTAEDCRFHNIALVSVNGASDLACLGAGATWGHRAYLCDGDGLQQHANTAAALQPHSGNSKERDQCSPMTSTVTALERNLAAILATRAPQRSFVCMFAY